MTSFAEVAEARRSRQFVGRDTELAVLADAVASQRLPATASLGRNIQRARADAVLRGPRATLGPPWSKDHRMALAATILVD